MGNVLTLTPPLTVTEAEMLDALAIVEEAIAMG
jgi:4-aminobutyrate aminotransferase